MAPRERQVQRHKVPLVRQRRRRPGLHEAPHRLEVAAQRRPVEPGVAELIGGVEEGVPRRRLGEVGEEEADGLWETSC